MASCWEEDESAGWLTAQLEHTLLPYCTRWVVVTDLMPDVLQV